MLKINEQEYCSRFFDRLTSFSLFPQITLPSRFTTCNGILINNFFCNLTKYMLESTAGILIKKFSDHQPHFRIMDTTLKKEHPIKYTNHNYNIILDEINQVKNKYMTSKLVKFYKYKHKVYMNNSRFASLNTTQR